MLLVIPVESIYQKLGGVILYSPEENRIIKQYVHDKKLNKKRVGWRGGKLYGETLISTDWTDLHYFDVRKWQYEKSFLKNTFNDLHYVEVFDGLLYIVNTGLDAIEIFEDPMNPKFKEIIFLFDKNPSLFQKRDIDMNRNYNKEQKIKPHSAHPNCIASNGKNIFVTCFGKNQKINSGEIIRLSNGRKCTKRNFDCHDGHFYNGKFYTTWTRHAQILEFESLNNSRAKRKIPIGPRAWWRGMVIKDDLAYVFASDGYKGKKKTTRLAIVNLNNSNKKIQKLPVVGGIHWDTIYQPNIYEE